MMEGILRAKYVVLLSHRGEVASHAMFYLFFDLVINELVKSFSLGYGPSRLGTIMNTCLRKGNGESTG